MKACRHYLIYCSILLAFSCSHQSSNNYDGPHFTGLKSDQTHIDFNNKITESDSVNFYTNEYMYIGSGTGVADFNNDGLQDIFFAGSQVSCKLYINKGNFQFEDVTEQAGIHTNVWCTGVSIVDINNDGLPDIYVCVSHSPVAEKRKNLLFINHGNLKFTEEAADYGLDDTGFSTQAAFFDYDKDGRLDMYLLNHRLYNEFPNNLVPKDTSGNSPAADKLYRNMGIPPGKTHPLFKDASKEAGIKEDGYGLGVVVSDFNGDNWPDVYVANDYIGNDELWLNNGNGTFTNCISRSMHHTSYNSMGTDAADINNDLLPDLAVLDMLPETNERKKMMFSGISPEKYDLERRLGYEPEFMRNMLQLNNGTRINNGKQEPFFSEIGQLAGISETDWSWSVLLADFDNDGWKDMYVTNGLAKDLTNSDFLSFRKNVEEQGYNFGGHHEALNANNQHTIDVLRKKLDEYGSIKVPNYLFLNKQGLQFKNITGDAGLEIPSISQGAAYVDLDNDGDLDLVVNNMNQEAFILRNDLRKSSADTLHNFLTVQLKGDSLNRNGIGAKLKLYKGAATQMLEQNPVRGYSSTVDNRLHFGVGNATTVDSLKIIWPDDKMQVVYNVKANQALVLDYANANLHMFLPPPAGQTLFQDVTSSMPFDFKHQETSFFDFGFQRMVPQKYSQLGPPLATEDINADGLTDFFIGGAANQSGMIYIQRRDGGFNSKPLVTGNKPEEDCAAVFFDANGDKHPDLLVTGGSTEFGRDLSKSHPRLYINDGAGNFTLSKDAFADSVAVISQAVAVGDFNDDGQPDLFIGGRLTPGNYPVAPRSYILENHKGKFIDVTNKVCPALESVGLITGAIVADFDDDGQPDLVVCGEWMPVRFFRNNAGKLLELPKEKIVGYDGQWKSIAAADVDGDGRVDFIVGNMGLNNKFHISPSRPLHLFATDIDNNGFSELIPAWYIKNDEGRYDLYPALDRSQLADEVPSIKKKYLLYSDFAKITMNQLLQDIGPKNYTDLTCRSTASSLFLNGSGKQFVEADLPIEAQFAPVNAILAEDFDGDGHYDLLIAGNEYQAEVTGGRYDASYGLFLKGDGRGHFTPFPPTKSGFIVDGDVKSMAPVFDAKGKEYIIVAVNDDKMKCFAVRSNQSK